jgi:hypothetical protein
MFFYLDVSYVGAKSKQIEYWNESWFDLRDVDFLRKVYNEKQYRFRRLQTNGRLRWMHTLPSDPANCKDLVTVFAF